ncbi:MAG: glycosyltransferase [Candidatus Nanopelagicales bacterium]|nr:glycosyltransferase [Candidatus Nanopelagicales bacterium]
MPPTVLHLSTYATNGGAARAATALHSAMLQEGIRSTLTTAHGTRFRITSELDRRLWRLQRSPTQTWRSPARFGSLSAKEINASDADVVNLHWVTDGFLSIEQIGRITKPIVWTLYDMWTFCGTEHYGVDAPDARWRAGYTKANRPSSESGWDLDRDAWERKRRHWLSTAVVPASTWLTQAAQGSALIQDWPISRIPHVVDATAFAPMEKGTAREALGLPQDVPLILFLASAGIADDRKGWDLLELALPAVKAAHPGVQVVVVGPSRPDYLSPSGVPIQWRGSIAGDEALRLHYSACDVTATPSREDNMPLTAMEAQTCGRPVVAFDIGGLPDIVVHHETGFLAPEGDIDALATGLGQALEDAQGENRWGRGARERALATWSGPVVVRQYLDVYEQVML